MRTIQDVQSQFAVSPETGLTPDLVEKSRQQYGPNRLTPLPREPLWKKFIAKFDEPIIKILLAAALLSMFVEMFRGDPDASVPGSPATAGIALAVVFAAAVALYALKMP